MLRTGNRECEPATRPTIYFIGVSTQQSLIMRVFPAWASALQLDAVIVGLDYPLDSRPEEFRAAVRFIKEDPLSRGALVTNHKVKLLHASRDLFDQLGENATILHEVSCISKPGHELRGEAMDAVSGGLALDRIASDGYWSSTGAEALLLGAGGSARALALALHRRAVVVRDVPPRLVVTDVLQKPLDEMREIHEAIEMRVPVEYVLSRTAEDNDAQMRRLAPWSLVINATGRGKDRPGSPLSDRCLFPLNGTAWDFNYRGDLRFLAQARAQARDRGVRAVDGWDYFVRAWACVVSEVLMLDVSRTGPEFERLDRIAATAAGHRSMQAPEGQ